ncbi:unnamed protein product [Urochloa decumbens]|uniref:Uncharacterized protein n=1 Tax=Urochloa decumbens TaxID=240449 RepID=A0ABC9AWP3_9POAL
MPPMSKASSDHPADLEKGRLLKPAATEDEDAGVVDRRKATCITVSLYMFVEAYMLFFMGVIAWMAKNLHNWWDPWKSALLFSAIMIWTISKTPKANDALISRYATKPAPASDCDASAKLLA